MRDVAVLSSQQMKSIQGLVGSTLDQSVLSTVELQRMKDTASGEIERRAAASRNAAASAKADGFAKAKARKQRMAELEMQRKAEVPLTDIEQAKMEAKAATLTSAEMQLSEELDDVKKMNQARPPSASAAHHALLPPTLSPHPLTLTLSPHSHPNPNPLTDDALRQGRHHPRRAGDRRPLPPPPLPPATPPSGHPSLAPPPPRPALYAPPQLGLLPSRRPLLGTGKAPRSEP